MANLTDKEIIAELKRIDEDDDVRVTPWEAKFLNTVLQQSTLSDKQRETANQIMDKYGCE